MEDKQKKKRGRAAKAELYVPSAGGGYRYIGGYYKYAEEQKLSWQRSAVIRLALGAAVLLMSLGCGLLQAPGMRNSFYVILPYAAEFVCAIALLWAACRAWYHGDEPKEYVYNATIVRLGGLTVFQAVLSGITAIGEVIFVILQGTDGCGVFEALAFPILQILVLIAAIIWKLFERKLEWLKKEK
ncbi:MAG: hypothetical protein J1E39_03390 [Eubacterium sp.]|nr:hypothetical protein [Eubacterium sp.]